MQDQNPFKAPEARVEDLRAGISVNFIPEGRRVPASHGFSWLLSGWRMFLQAPLIWIALSLIFSVMTLTLGFIPLVNLVLNLLTPIFAGGIMIGCKSLEEGGELRIDHLFAGFAEHSTNLLLIGLVYLGGIVALTMIMILLAGGSIGVAVLFGSNQMGGAAAGAAAGLGVLVFLAVMLFFVPLAMAVWYAPPLVVFHNMQPLDAIKASFMASLKNFLPFLVYGLLFMMLALLASLPFLLGWLVLIPVAQASVYAGYRDMFTTD